MKLLNIPLGLIINFYEERLVDGIVRMIFPGGESVNPEQDGNRRKRSSCIASDPLGLAACAALQKGLVDVGQ